MRKRSKYEIIARTHHFVLVVVETSGSPGPVCRDRQAGLRCHTRDQGTGLPPPAGVRSPAAWQCSISVHVGVNGLCLTFSVKPCDRISSSFKIGTNYMYYYCALHELYMHAC